MIMNVLERLKVTGVQYPSNSVLYRINPILLVLVLVRILFSPTFVRFAFICVLNRCSDKPSRLGLLRYSNLRSQSLLWKQCTHFSPVFNRFASFMTPFCLLFWLLLTLYPPTNASNLTETVAFL